MSIWNSNQLIGIELEAYIDNGMRAVDHLNHHLVATGFADDLTVTYDASLGRRGAEIIFSRPTPISKSRHLIDKLNKISLDKINLNTKFITKKSNKHIPKNSPATYSEYRYNEYGCGATGLHIHFDIGTSYHPMDIIRLVQKMYKDRAKINKLAWRSDSHWSPSALKHIKSINASIDRARLYTNEMTSLSVFTCKYCGVNIANINNRYGSKHTIEFRYADASLMSDKVAFENYLTYLKTTWDECFTGEDLLKWNGKYFLKYEVVDGHKLIGLYENNRGKVGNLINHMTLGFFYNAK